MDAEERARKREILETKKARKHERDIQAARLGVNADPIINTERRELAREIALLERELRDSDDDLPSVQPRISGAIPVVRAQRIYPSQILQQPRHSLFEFFVGNRLLVLLLGAVILVIFLLATPNQGIVSRLLSLFEPKREANTIVHNGNDMVSMVSYNVQGDFIYTNWRFVIKDADRPLTYPMFNSIITDDSKHLSAESGAVECQKTPFDEYLDISSLPDGMLDCRSTARTSLYGTRSGSITLSVKGIGNVLDTWWSVTIPAPSN
jgi:hypothetical protein